MGCSRMIQFLRVSCHHNIEIILAPEWSAGVACLTDKRGRGRRYVSVRLAGIESVVTCNCDREVPERNSERAELFLTQSVCQSGLFVLILRKRRVS